MKRASAEAVVPALALRSVQEEFLAGLRGGAAGELPGSGVFQAPPRGTTEDRWEVYRRAYVVRLVEAIRNDYPATARILGAEAFASLIRRYLGVFPPSSHDIGRAGDRLAEFLRGDALTEGLPFLPDLARFEAALAAAVVAADGVPVTRGELAALDPETLLDLPVSLAPGAARILSEWPLGDLWECRDKPGGEVSVEVYGRPAQLVIYREGFAVRWREIAADEADFLAAAERGTTLATLAGDGSFGPPEEAVPRLVAVFLRLIEPGILHLALPEAPPGVSSTCKENP